MLTVGTGSPKQKGLVMSKSKHGTQTPWINDRNSIAVAAKTAIKPNASGVFYGHQTSDGTPADLRAEEDIAASAALETHRRSAHHEVARRRYQRILGHRLRGRRNVQIDILGRDAAVCSP